MSLQAKAEEHTTATAPAVCSTREWVASKASYASTAVVRCIAKPAKQTNQAGSAYRKSEKERTWRDRGRVGEAKIVLNESSEVHARDRRNLPTKPIKQALSAGVGAHRAPRER